MTKSYNLLSKNIEIMARKNRHLKRKHKIKKELRLKTRRELKNRRRHWKKKISTSNNARRYIKNFTMNEVKNNELLLLSKGLKFIPNPSIKYAKQELLRDWNNLERKMRLKFNFANKEDKYKFHPFLQKSDYTPEFGNSALENFLFQAKADIERMPILKQNKNLTKDQKQALELLKRNKDIIIKKADKNSTTVLMDKTLYINQGLKHLEGNKHYENVSTSRMVEIIKNIKDITLKLYKSGKLDKITYDYLSEQNNEKVGRFYTLPKLHKINDNILTQLEEHKELLSQIEIPGRPIISLCGSPTERISRYLDYFLRKIVAQQWTYTQDTTSFINKIEKIKLPNDCIMGSFDASSMYQNMEHHEIFEAINRAWTKIESSKFDIPTPTKNEFLNLLNIVLKNNEFEFNGKLYRQKIGVPMGSPASPSLTDIRMFEIITELVNTFPYKNKIIHLSIYRDDGFILYSGTKEELLTFFSIANNIHSLLKFTYEIATNNLKFLDVEVFKGPRFQNHNILDFRIYRKPTENYQYLHRSSAHPPSVFKGLVIGEITRIIRCTNNQSDIKTQIDLLFEHLRKRGYSQQELDKIRNYTSTINRKTTLQYKIKNKNKKPPLVFATKYNPCFKQLGKIIRKHWYIIEKDETTKKLFPKPPIIAYKKHKSLKDMLTSAKIK